MTTASKATAWPRKDMVWDNTFRTIHAANRTAASREVARELRKATYWGIPKVTYWAVRAAVETAVSEFLGYAQ